jgi:hypothetical protein
VKRFVFGLSTALISLLLGGCGHSTSSTEATSVPELTDAQKYTLAYMWNEEKLAKEIYLALYGVWEGQTVTLYNIATQSETRHIAAVEGLVEAYDINITNLDDYNESYSEAELRALAPGEYAIPELQELYDTLYIEGSSSEQQALEVGCKVEVRDIADLNESIAIASGIDDLVSTFELLRLQSYQHYKEISDTLKSMGVTEGCCILGDGYCLEQ